MAVDLEQPPNDLEAERCVLGAMCLNDQLEMVRPVASSLQPNHFYYQSHRRLFECITHLLENGKPVDVVVVAHEMQRRGWMRHPVTTSFLVEIIEAVPHAYHVEHYAAIVLEMWRRRRMQELAHWLQQRASDMTQDVDDTWERVGREAGRQRRLKTC